MNMHPVTSSQLHSIGYDPETKTLAIKFKTGGVYHYADVPESEHKAMMAAPSHGKHFYANIKGKFKFTKQS